MFHVRAAPRTVADEFSKVAWQAANVLLPLLHSGRCRDRSEIGLSHMGWQPVARRKKTPTCNARGV